MTICKKCINELYFKYFEETKDISTAIRRICMKWDIYFDESMTHSSSMRSTTAKIVGVYLKNLNTGRANVHKTYDDTIREEGNRSRSAEDLPELAKTTNISEESLMEWGLYFDPDDYIYLNNQYNDWQAKIVIDSKSRETLVRDLCIIKLHQQKAIKEQQVELFDKLQKTYQSTLASADLKPKQQDASDELGEKSVGMMIDMFENERPVPKPLKEWEDIDNIIKFFTVYCLGHLCKMLGLRNKYSKIYEDEMQRFRIEIPELEDSDDEDVFEYLLNNGGDSILE